MNSYTQYIRSSTSNYIVFFVCLFLNLFTISAQKKTPSSLYLTGGISLGAQDRRLFFYPDREGIIDREKSFLDYEYNISINKKLLHSKKLIALAGIGYSERNNTFSRPFALHAFGVLTREGRVIKRYTINEVIASIRAQYLVKESKQISLNFIFLPNCIFRKSVKDISYTKRETKWGFDFSSLEIYTGLSKSINTRLTLGVNYRVLYMNKIDPVIFFEGLFSYPDYSFMEKKFDLHNPFKLWFTAEYRLGK